METNEKRKMLRNAKIQWSRQIAFILQSKLKEIPVREECENCHFGDPMFETSCDYVNFRYEISKLANTLSNQADYMKLLIDQDF